MDTDSLDPASATTTDLLQASGLDVQAVTYKAGLVQSFSGSSTLNPPETLGSGLPLRNTNDPTAVSDFIETFDPAAAQNLSGVSTPGFPNAAASMPNPNASPLSDAAFNAVNGLSKFGASLAIMLGLHPVEQKNDTGQVAASIKPSFQVSGTQVAIMAIVTAALVILLLKHGGE